MKSKRNLGLALGLVTTVLGASTCAQVIGLDHDYTRDSNLGGGGDGGFGGGTCEPGFSETCYSGPKGVSGVGACKLGMRACLEDGMGYGPCQGDVLPEPEVCDNQIDDNCDGSVNEACPCTPGTSEACYSGPAGTENMGLCKAGTHTCLAGGSGYGPCMGEVIPTSETCGTPEDEDCDGQAYSPLDSDCVCVPGVPESCMTGLSGVCANGMGICNATGTSVSACQSVVMPSFDDCATPDDEDCDGTTPVCTGTILNSNGLANASDSAYYAVTTDKENNIITGGVTNGTVSGYAVTLGSFRLSKHDPNGSPIWSKVASPGLTNHAVVRGVAVDSEKSILAVGELRGTIAFPGSGNINSSGTNNPDLLVVKFSEDGSFLWGKRFGNSEYQAGFRVAVNANDEVFITGAMAGFVAFDGIDLTSNGGLDAVVVKLSKQGTVLWANNYGSLNDQVGLGIVATPDGEVVVGGSFEGTIVFGAPLSSAGSKDLFVAKLDGSNGNPIWMKSFGDGESQDFYDMAVDPMGNIAFTGTMKGALNFGGVLLNNADISDTTTDVYIAKLSGLNGSHIWSDNYGDDGEQAGEGITMDAAGNVSLTGYFEGMIDFGGGNLTSAGAASGATDVFVAKFASATGAHLWSAGYGDPSDQVGWSIATNLLGQTVISGGFEGTLDFGAPGGPLTNQAGMDAFLAKFSP